jgi:hypothetical protein
MNSTDAATLAKSLNDTLKSAGADIYATYKVFSFWSVDFYKLYNVVMIPTALSADYESATDSQKLAFARVSLCSQLGEPTSYESFINEFNSNTTKDTELNDYLNK